MRLGDLGLLSPEIAQIALGVAAAIVPGSFREASWRMLGSTPRRISRSHGSLVKHVTPGGGPSQHQAAKSCKHELMNATQKPYSGPCVGDGALGVRLAKVALDAKGNCDATTHRLAYV